MEKEIILGKRILRIGCSNRCIPLIQKRFITILHKGGFKRKLISLMNELKIPQEVIINFKHGKGDLYGQYYVNDNNTEENLIVIDIYTKSMENGLNNDPNFDLDLELLDTFIHELVHHAHEKEKATKKRVNKFMKDISWI
jgi:hypothetical protein